MTTDELRADATRRETLARAIVARSRAYYVHGGRGFRTEAEARAAAEKACGVEVTK